MAVALPKAHFTPRKILWRVFSDKRIFKINKKKFFLELTVLNMSWILDLWWIEWKKKIRMKFFFSSFSLVFFCLQEFTENLFGPLPRSGQACRHHWTRGNTLKTFWETESNSDGSFICERFWNFKTTFFEKIFSWENRTNFPEKNITRKTLKIFNVQINLYPSIIIVSRWSEKLLITFLGLSCYCRIIEMIKKYFGFKIFYWFSFFQIFQIYSQVREFPWSFEWFFKKAMMIVKKYWGWGYQIKSHIK